MCAYPSDAFRRRHLQIFIPVGLGRGVGACVCVWIVDDVDETRIHTGTLWSLLFHGDENYHLLHTRRHVPVKQCRGREVQRMDVQ